MPFGELLLSASLQVALDRLVPREFKAFTRLVRVDSDLEELEEMILMIQDVLHDAGQKQITNRAVRKWLEKLTHLAYDIDDLLDEVATDARRLKLEEETQLHTNQVSELLHSLRNFWSNGKQIGKIQALKGRLDKVWEQGQRLGLSQGVAHAPSYSGISQRPPTTSLVQDSRVYGREKDVEQILKLLSSDKIGNSNFSVTSIVGLGGVGKTTLAQLLYKHEYLKDLNPKGWVCVSDRFDVTRITKAILESTTGTPSDLSELQSLQVELKGILKGKKFLIVLDDIWTENSSDWHALRAPFEVGCRGSKIVVTTRSTQVASIMGSVHTYHLNKLSEEECRSLFNQHSFENGSPDAHPQLKSIGEKIVEKCDGLPLAAKALGGLLCGKLEISEWELILNSEIWDLAEDKSVDILPSLKLSYHYLPAHLKQCFSYCAIFPQDYIFYKKELILLWMAEGFLQPKGQRRMEDVGDEYFRELLSRSFFQPHKDDEPRGFVMHDLILDVARFVSKGICFHFRDGMEGDNSTETDVSLARYALVPMKNLEVMSKFEVFQEARTFRTFLLKSYAVFGSLIPERLPFHLFPQLQCLRVLGLSGCHNISELPESIGNLTHLRHLDLSMTPIRDLPVSLSKLLNLQTLLLKDCKHLVDLITDISNLTELRHLDIQGCRELTRMPLGMSKLTNLQTLTCFVSGASSGSSIKELKELKQLRGKLDIVGLKNVVDCYGAILGNKEHMDELGLNWGHFLDDDIESAYVVIEELQPHTNLKKLIVQSYCGIRFPSWLGHSSYSNLTNLKLIDCRKCQLLPPLGCLPSLKYLLVERMWNVKKVGFEFYGGVHHASNPPFQSLEILIFQNMKSWKDWSGIEDDREALFPRLRELEIYDCPKLRKFSHRFVKLEKLKIRNCGELIELPRCLPVLCRLEAEGCDAMVFKSMVDSTPPPPLSFLEISRISNLENLLVSLEGGGGGRSFWGYLNALEELHIERCNKLVKLLSSNEVRQGMQCLSSLRVLKIYDCPQLECLSDDEDVLPLNSLSHLVLHSCPRLRFLKLSSPEIVSIRGCDRLNIRMMHCTSLRELEIGRWPGLVCSEEKIELPSTLRRLAIYECKNLKMFPALMMPNNNNNRNDSFIDSLRISHCESLTSFTTEDSSSSTGFRLLPKSLCIQNCESLQSLPERMTCGNRFLEDLRIRGCEKLTSLPNGMYKLTSLRSLTIERCRSLVSFPNGMYKLTSLRSLTIDSCRSLVSFPNGGLAMTALSKLEIRGCESLRSLPDGLHNAMSLQSLCIRECLNLDPFPKGGFPRNLQSLEIRNCIKHKPISEWGLQNLTSLGSLIIGGFSGLVFFPDCVLPPNLTRLSLHNFPDLQFLPGGLHSLTSLQSLSIYNCKNLTIFPEKGLPSSLEQLNVGGCPLLEKRCEKEKGEDWPKIADIPSVVFVR